MTKKFLLGLTTTPGSDWRGKIKETKALKITEIALFLTGLKKEERKELYGLLDRSPVKNIPHVHLRSDVDSLEMEYLLRRYKTKVFNHHPFPQHLLEYDLSKYFSIIFIENTEIIPSEEELKKFGGICVDFSHWENANLTACPYYAGFEEKVKKYKIGCGHISAIRKESGVYNNPMYPEWKGYYDNHYFNDLKELDYLKKYFRYLPEFVSLELENSFAEQLRAKKYLETIIK